MLLFFASTTQSIINECIVRSYDGSTNNLMHSEYGEKSITLTRKSNTMYGDGSNTLVERTPEPRVISNNICKATKHKLNSKNLTDIVWMWGQFIDHDMSLTLTSDIAADMTTPKDDEYPSRRIPFMRSNYRNNSNPRQQLNELSSFIDGTNIYGSTIERANALRTLDGTGKLKTNTHNGQVLLPYNVDGFENQPSNDKSYFFSGDIRVNENTLLTSIHTLFVREHNRICDELADSVHAGCDEYIYQYARKTIISIMQVITYQEFLPALLGKNVVSKSAQYDNTINPSIATEFSTVGYRIGHSMLSSVLKIGLNDTIRLRDMFFNPSWIKVNGIESIIQGAINNVMQEIDNEIIDDVRDFLFGLPTDQLMDLASLNIQRGRDHGIPDYNTLREAYGLEKYNNFNQITNDESLRIKLMLTYKNIDSIDPWIGALCEDHIDDAAVGQLILTIMKEQFIRLQKGDRFWWENDNTLTLKEKKIISSTKLSDIIKRNTAIKNVPIDVFHQ